MILVIRKDVNNNNLLFSRKFKKLDTLIDLMFKVYSQFDYYNLTAKGTFGHWDKPTNSVTLSITDYNNYDSTTIVLWF